ncbi:Cell division cycle-related protein res1/sct1 [Schizosaccharomyces pombe]
MKRCHDNWLNATQILKIAELDKPRRTRILEKFAQKGLHEKIQGGCGKYQGTWVPSERAVELAHEYNVFDLIQPLIEYSGSAFMPMSTFTPQSNRKPTEAYRRNSPVKKSFSRPSHSLLYPYTSSNNMTSTSRMSGIHDALSLQSDFTRSPGMPSDSFTGSLHDIKASPFSSNNYVQSLLDYFLLPNTTQPPDFVYDRPSDWDVNAGIDEDGHTALHWAAAMGNLEMMHALLQAGANVVAVNYLQQTSLMRCVMFTMNYDLQTFEVVSELLQSAICMNDSFGQTVFHHIALLASSKSKMEAARYYMDILLQNLTATQSVDVAAQIINLQDDHGDTALLICARNGAKKCARLLLSFYASSSIPNNQGQYPTDFLSSKDMSFPENDDSPLNSKIEDNLIDNLKYPQSLDDHLSSKKPISYFSNKLTHQTLPNVFTQLSELSKCHEASLAEKQLTYNLAMEALEQTVRETETCQRLWNECTNNDENYLVNQREDLIHQCKKFLHTLKTARYYLETVQLHQLKKYVTYFSQIWSTDELADISETKNLVGHDTKTNRSSLSSKHEVDLFTAENEAAREKLVEQLCSLQAQRKQKINEILNLLSMGMYNTINTDQSGS